MPIYQVNINNPHAGRGTAIVQAANPREALGMVLHECAHAGMEWGSVETLVPATVPVPEYPGMKRRVMVPGVQEVPPPATIEDVIEIDSPVLYFDNGDY